MRTFFLILIFFNALLVDAQVQMKKCVTAENYSQRLQYNSTLQSESGRLEAATKKWMEENSSLRKSLSLISIPVVVHVVYHDSTENISDAQILSQIEALNRDFRKLNADTLFTGHPFASVTSDTYIEFCLATADTNGMPTTGITRTYTDSLSFPGDSVVKFDATGGKDAWDPHQYLNVWVCNLQVDSIILVGYSSHPSELSLYPEEDGVVINYIAFGDTGTAVAPVNKGRTMVHEIGHWLDLIHIWGDNICGDDKVADTRVAFTENYDCPAFPRNSHSICAGSDEAGEMYMNYMDYVDDDCMVMFTQGQADRMRACLNGVRSKILTSQGCSLPSSLGIAENNLIGPLTLYPNPASERIFVQLENYRQAFTINVYTLLGSKVKTLQAFPGNTIAIDVRDLPVGVYLVEVMGEQGRVTKKICITK